MEDTMKLRWLMIVALGVALTGCGGVDTPAVEGAEKADIEQIQSMTDLEFDSMGSDFEIVASPTGNVSAAGTDCTQYAYTNGSCGCDAGSSCGYTRYTYSKNCICSAPDGSCRYCSCSPWTLIGTSCIASSSCTYC
jgi:hypothetical protein